MIINNFMDIKLFVFQSKLIEANVSEPNTKYEILPKAKYWYKSTFSLSKYNIKVT